MALTYSLLLLYYDVRHQVYSILDRMLTLSMPQFWYAYHQIEQLSKGFVWNLMDLCDMINHSPSSYSIKTSVPTLREPS